RMCIRDRDMSAARDSEAAGYGITRCTWGMKKDWPAVPGGVQQVVLQPAAAGDMSAARDSEAAGYVITRCTGGMKKGAHEGGVGKCLQARLFLYSF
ncbi:MAG: hypothetical protein ACOC6C_06660, partial [Verrucomicrobiota bacterium]